MSYPHEWGGRRMLSLAAAIVIWASSDATASRMGAAVTYDTSGSIGSNDMTGSQVVSFQGVEGGSLTTPTPFQPGTFVYPIPDGQATSVPLGEFVVTPPASGTTTYKDTHFLINLRVDSIDGVVPGAETRQVVLAGALNGMINSTGTSSLTATFLAILDPGPPFFPKFAAGSFLTGDVGQVLTTPDYQISLNPSTTRNGRTSVDAVLVSTKLVPEPGTLVVFLAAFASLVYRCRFRSAN